MIDCNNKPLKVNDRIYVMGMMGNTSAKVKEDLGAGFILVTYGDNVEVAHYKNRIKKQ